MFSIYTNECVKCKSHLLIPLNYSLLLKQVLFIQQIICKSRYQGDYKDLHTGSTFKLFIVLCMNS